MARVTRKISTIICPISFVSNVLVLKYQAVSIQPHELCQKSYIEEKQSLCCKVVYWDRKSINWGMKMKHLIILRHHS